MEKSIIIIGAGIAGLSAGCYGQMNGYRTQIFEMHSLPGGLCTSWKRKGYIIDGCMHWLLGANPGTGFFRVWEELGAIQGRSIVNQEEYIQFEDEKGDVFSIYTDINRLERHMKKLAPEDTKIINKILKDVRKCTRIEIPVEKARELYSPLDGIKMMIKVFPLLLVMRKWGKVSTLKLADKFRNPLIRQALFTYAELPDYSTLVLLMALAWHHRKHAGYPVGGSLEFARAIERRYLELGGEIHFQSPVEKILVENHKAVGIRLIDGTEHHGNLVISAADGHTTIFDMLQGKYTDKKIRDVYDRSPLFPPLIQVAFGVARSFDEIPHLVSGINFPLKEPFIIAGQEIKRLGVHIYNYDPTVAPEGKTLVKVLLNTNYYYWNRLKQDTAKYKAEKEHIADKVIHSLEQKFTGISKQIEMQDVATPLTWERYTGNWQASHEGWLMTTKNLNMRLSKILPELENFYMAGQWVEPGGSLPYVALSGRNVIQIICRKDNKPFFTTIP